MHSLCLDVFVFVEFIRQLSFLIKRSLNGEASERKRELILSKKKSSMHDNTSFEHSLLGKKKKKKKNYLDMCLIT